MSPVSVRLRGGNATTNNDALTTMFANSDTETKSSLNSKRPSLVTLATGFHDLVHQTQNERKLECALVWRRFNAFQVPTAKAAARISTGLIHLIKGREAECLSKPTENRAESS